MVCVTFRDLPPNQGGRYAGFGNTAMPEKKDYDYWSAFSSVSLPLFLEFVLFVLFSLHLIETPICAQVLCGEVIYNLMCKSFMLFQDYCAAVLGSHI